MSSLTTQEKMSKGIIDLQRDQPFFALLTMRLRISEMSAGLRQGLQARGLSATAGVDAAGRLVFAPEFIEKLSREEVQGLLCHEVMHVALLHLLRTGTRNHTMANIAQDCVVNCHVIRSGLSLPAGGIPYDRSYDSCKAPLGQGHTHTVTKVSEKDWETIYDELMQACKDQKIQPMPDGYKGFDVHMRGKSTDGSGKDGDGDGEGEALTNEEIEAIAREWTDAVVDAATYAQKIGKLPAGMERFINGLLKPKVSWKQELLRYIKPLLSPVDYTYRRPHKKSQALGVYMPNIEREHLTVEVLVDTSGSIDNDTLRMFLSEVVAIAESHQHVKMFVTFCDTHPERFEVNNGDIPKLFAQKCKGGGGTELENGLDKIDKEGDEEVSVAICLTDGYNSWRNKRNMYHFDVVWVITPNGTTKDIPYGKVIPMDKGGQNDN